MKRILTVFLSLYLLVGHAFANPDSVVFDGGDVRINGAGNGLVFPDGSIQYSATVQGPAGPQGLPGQQGPACQVSLAAICAAISAENKVLPSFCSSATLLSIAVSPRNTYMLSGGMTSQFTAIGTFSDNSKLDLTASVVWSSSNPSVATISNSNIGGSIGKATSTSAGLTMITATSGSYSDSASLTVLKMDEFANPTIGNSYYLVAGPDGNLWFIESNANKIGRITTAGVITEFTLPTSPNNISSPLASGSDGNLWFIETLGNTIGRITTTGVITEFAIPTSNSSSYLSQIIAGPDGNLWFTESNANKIGRITTSGVITEFTIPTSGSNASNLTAGPDGNLWFTEYNANKIGRITTAGVFTEFIVPTSFSSPYALITGPDGNLWFIETYANPNKLGRITTAGVISEFAIPTTGSNRITVGPDGNLWFIEVFSNYIARVTTEGVITEIAIPPNSIPSYLAAGPDGNLWFIEMSNKIGRITIKP